MKNLFVWVFKRIIKVFFFSSIFLLVQCTTTEYWVHYAEESMAAPGVVLALVKDNDDNLWAASGLTGEVHFYAQSANTWQFKSIPGGGDLSGSQTIYIAQTGDVFVGTKNGLVRYQVAFNKWIRYSEENGLPHDDIRAILQDTEGILWLGTGGGGLYKSNGNINTWQKVTEVSGFDDIVTVYTLYRDSHNNLWVGTGVSLFKYDQGMKKWLQYPSYHVVRSIIEDSRGFLWFATINGAYQYDPVHDQWTAYTMDEGLRDNEVWAVNEDLEGNIWFGTKTGVTRFNQDKDQWISFSKEDGFSDFTTTSIVVANSGQLWFGTFGDGIYRYDPDQ